MRTGNEDPRTVYDEGPKVAIHTRVVPHGIEMRDGKSLAKATLLLSPGEVKTDGSGISLAHWPSAVCDLLMRKRPSLLAKPLAEGGVAQKIGAGDTEEIEFALSKLSDLTPGQWGDIAMMWHRSLWPEGKAPLWNELAAQLGRSLTGQTVQTDAVKDKDTAPPSEAIYGADGQLAPKTPKSRAPARQKVTSALSIGHASLAIALESQRAQALNTSFLQACGVAVKKQVMPLKLPVSSEVKDHAAANYPKEIDAYAKSLVEVIAKQKPRNGRSLRQYAEDLAQDEKLKEKVDEGGNRIPVANPTDLIIELMMTDKYVVAELRRKRKMAERRALFDSLQTARESATKLYNDALMAMKADKKADAPALHWAATAETPLTCATGVPDFAALTCAAQYANWPQYRTATDPEAGVSKKDATPSVVSQDQLTEEQADALEKASRAFFTMQSTPSLARAFCLAVEIEIETRELDRITGYGHLMFDVGEVSASCVPRNWTLFRKPPLSDASIRSGFWPVTVGEADMNGQRDSTRHYGGLMVMGLGASGKAGKHVPRFDVTTLDIRTALELETQRRTSKQADLDAENEARDSQADEKERQRKTKTESTTGRMGAAKEGDRHLYPGVTTMDDPDTLPQDDPRLDDGDRQDVGLTLLDRGAISDAIQKMARKAAKCGADSTCNAICPEGVVIDAEDLTTGYRLYAGTPNAQNGTDWAPLMSRWIEFGTSGPDLRLRSAIEPVLRTLIGRVGSPARIALESAMMNTPGRMLPKAAEVEDEHTSEAVFEEAVSVWDGGPMGVDCSELPGQANTTGDALIFGRTLNLPSKGDARLTRLRYGQPVRLALPVVYSGGISVPPEAFPQPGTGSSHTPAQDLYYPSHAMAARAGDADSKSDVRPFVRPLRQGKIGNPQIVIPQGHALRTNGPMALDHAGLMVVRSLDDAAKASRDKRITARARPKVAQRLIMVPTISQARAVMHTDLETHKGVFDGAPKAAHGGPRGAYPAMQQNAVDANLPSLRTSHLTGFNGRQHFDARKITTDNTPLAEGETQDGAVFAPRASQSSRYYPDPAADALAVRLHLRGRDKPITMESADDLVQLYADNAYPELRPVVLSLRPVTPDGTNRNSWGDYVKQKKAVRFDPTAQGDITGRGGFRGAELALGLAMHEWADVEMWFVPSARRLARDFSVLQSLAIDLAQKGELSLACCAANVIEGAANNLPDHICGDLEKAIADNGGHRAYFGPGGIASPPMRVLLALAEQITAKMISHPMPEIAATARVSAVAAANRALTAPSISGTDTAHFNADIAAETCINAPLRAWRPTPDVIDANADIDPDEVAQDVACLCPEETTGLAVAEEGSTQLVLTGEVYLDLNQIDTIEVRAEMILPGTTTFDDRFRGRSLSHRVANWWPLKRDPRGAPARTTDAEFLPGHELFGFDVAADGAVTLGRAEVTLLRADRLPRPGDGSCKSTVSLRALFEERDPRIAVSERHVFADGKARRMNVYINALPRTAEFMRTIDRRVRSGDAWISSKGPAYQSGDLVAGEALPAKAQRKVSETVEVILPATLRPAKPDAKAPEPGFRWNPAEDAVLQDGKLNRRRASVVRIPLGREWYSSGEDEMLGIVLWPPSLMADDLALRDNDAILRRGTGETERRIDLDGSKLRDCTPLSNTPPPIPPFQDGHLGPGGAFVSRRGADPVRQGVPHKQIFFTPQDFPDLKRDAADAIRAGLVQNVLMPLSDAPDKKDKDAKEDIPPEQPQPPMMVSLLTYKPRFDAKNEEWFVEVELAESAAAETFVRLGLVRYQPHTRPDLRCSPPVVQWVQPLPERKVEVWRLRDDTGWRVRMCGDTFNRRRLSDAVLAALPDLEATPTCPPGGDGVIEGEKAAPRMGLSLRRAGVDAAGRPYQETVPLPVPVPAMGTGSLLLRPLDHDTGVLPGGHAFEPLHGAGLAARVLVEAAYTTDGNGIWVADIKDSVLNEGDPSGTLFLLVEEVETFEPDTPITRDARDRLREQSAMLTPAVPRQPFDGDSAQNGIESNSTQAETGTDSKPLAEPQSLAPSFDLAGPRFMGAFDLSVLQKSGNPK